MKLLPDYNMTAIAFRYYNALEPNKYPDSYEGRRAANKNFSGAKHINKSVFEQVLKEVLIEQLKSV